MKNQKKSAYKNYLRFSTIAFQMGIIIAAGALGGNWLDEKQENHFPVWTLVLVLTAIFAALYLVIKEVTKMGKEEEKKKK